MEAFEVVVGAVDGSLLFARSDVVLIISIEKKGTLEVHHQKAKGTPS